MSNLRRHYTYFDDTTPPSEKRQVKRAKAEPIDLELPEITHSAPVALPIVTEVKLSQEQQAVVNLIVSDHNVFYTGSAGSRKSKILRAAVKRLRERGKRVRITAPTGRAALDVSGTTAWTFAGWSPNDMKKSIKELEKRATARHIRKRMLETDVLIIDEISMVENHFFERLNRIMKSARESEDPFGGVQIVVTGDFCQLPPVKPFEYCMECGKATKEELIATERSCPDHGMFSDSDKWVFLSHAWQDADFSCISLWDIHRQTDRELIAMLQKIRAGEALSEFERDRLINHTCVDMKDAVQLFATREQVEKLNVTEFAKLPSEKRVYYCLDYANIQPRHTTLKQERVRSRTDNSPLALNGHKYEPILELKKGMLVMLLINLDIEAGLVNGSQGRIVGFRPHNNAELEKPKNKFVESSANIDDKEERHVSQSVVSLGGSYHTLQFEQMREFIRQDRNTYKFYPIVQFQNGKTVTIVSDCRVSELGDDKPYSLIARCQIPLCPAWAITIHKSQGMTLDKVKVDLTKAWEEGQEYVALSRARTLEGLKVEGLRHEFTGSGGNEGVKAFLHENFAHTKPFQRPRGLE